MQRTSFLGLLGGLKQRTAALLCIVAAVVPAAVALHTMCTNWVSVPYWDAWQTPGAQIAAWCRGTLTFGELFSQHNEHRPFFSRLVYVGMAAAMGWDVRREMAIGFLLLCIASTLLYVLLRQSGVRRTLSLAALAVMTLLLFTPRQYENLLSGMEGASFLPSLALICAAAMNMSRNSLAWKTATNAILALVSTYTFGNGMLLWPLAFPLGRSDPESGARTWLLRGSYIASGVVAIAAYFISYVHPPLAPAPAHVISDAVPLLHFVARWLGAFFLAPAPAFIGAVALAAFATLAAMCLKNASGTGAWWAYYPWLLLGAYAAVSGGIAARARLGFGLEMAGDARYTAFTVFFHIALVGLGATMLSHAPAAARGALFLRLGAAGYAAVILALSVNAYAKQRHATEKFRATRAQVRAIVQRSPATSDNPELKLVSPYADTAETIRTLFECGVLRLRRELPDPAEAR